MIHTRIEYILAHAYSFLLYLFLYIWAVRKLYTWKLESSTIWRSLVMLAEAFSYQLAARINSHDSEKVIGRHFQSHSVIKVKLIIWILRITIMAKLLRQTFHDAILFLPPEAVSTQQFVGFKWFLLKPCFVIVSPRTLTGFFDLRSWMYILQIGHFINRPFFLSDLVWFVASLHYSLEPSQKVYRAAYLTWRLQLEISRTWI